MKRSILRCYKCQKVYHETSYWNAHIKICNKDIQLKFPCSICGKNFIHEKRLHNHMLKIHTMPKKLLGQVFKCPYCNREYKKDGKNLQKHIKNCGTEKEIKPFQVIELHPKMDPTPKIEIPFIIPNPDYNPWEVVLPDCVLLGKECNVITNDEDGITEYCSVCGDIKKEYKFIVDTEFTSQNKNYGIKYDPIKYHHKLQHQLEGLDKDGLPIEMIYDKEFAFSIYDKLPTPTTWLDIYNVYKEVLGSWYKEPRLKLLWLSANKIFNFEIPPVTDQMLTDINCYQEFFRIQKQITKKNSTISFWYLVYKLVELFIPSADLRAIPMKFSQNVLDKYDSIWKSICIKEHYQFIRTKTPEFIIDIDSLKLKWEGPPPQIKISLTPLPLSRPPYSMNKKRKKLEWDKPTFQKLLDLKRQLLYQIKIYYNMETEIEIEMSISEFLCKLQLRDKAPNYVRTYMCENRNSKPKVDYITWYNFNIIARKYFYHCTLEPIVPRKYQPYIYQVLLCDEQLQYCYCFDQLGADPGYVSFYNPNVCHEMISKATIFINHIIYTYKNKQLIKIPPPPSIANESDACIFTVGYEFEHLDQEEVYHKPLRLRGGGRRRPPIRDWLDDYADGRQPGSADRSPSSEDEDIPMGGVRDVVNSDEEDDDDIHFGYTTEEDEAYERYEDTDIEDLDLEEDEQIQNLVDEGIIDVADIQELADREDEDLEAWEDLEKILQKERERQFDNFHLTNNSTTNEDIIQDFVQNVDDQLDDIDEKQQEGIYWGNLNERNRRRAIIELTSSLYRQFRDELAFVEFRTQVINREGNVRTGRIYTYYPQNLREFANEARDYEGPLRVQLNSNERNIEDLFSAVGVKVRVVSNRIGSGQRRITNYYNPHGGDFPYITTLFMDVRDFGIYSTYQQFKSTCCLLVAILPQIQEVLPNKYNQIKDRLETLVRNRVVKKKNLQLVAEYSECDIFIKYYYINNRNRSQVTMKKPVYRCKISGAPKLYIGLIKNHYFRNDPDSFVNITSFAMKHYNEIKDLPNWNLIYKKRKEKNRNNPWKYHTEQSFKPLAPHQFIKLLYDNPHLLRPIPQPIIREPMEEDEKELPLNVSKGSPPLGTKVFTTNGYNYKSKHIPSMKIFKDFKDQNKHRYMVKLPDEEFQYLFQLHNTKRITEETFDTTLYDYFDPTLLNTIRVRDITLQLYIEEIKKSIDSNGIRRVKYHKQLNRDYTIDSKCTIQRIPKKLRHLLCDPYYYYIDIENSCYVISSFIYQKQYGRKTPYMIEFIETRNEVYNTLLSNTCTKKNIKTFFLQLLHGNQHDVDTFINTHVNDDELGIFIDNLRSEIYRCQKFIQQKDRMKITTIYSKNKDGNKLHTYLSSLVYEWESKLLDFSIEFLKENKIITHSFYSKIFDGLYFLKTHSERTIEIILQQLNKTIYHKFKLKASFYLEENSYPEYRFLDITTMNKKIKINQQSTQSDNYHIGFFDFETDTHYFDGSDYIHREYCVGFCIDNQPIEFIWGENCALDMLEIIPDRTLLIAHNLNYDYRFLVRHRNVTISDENHIYHNNRIMTAEIHYKGKRIYLKDSYVLISKPLRDFPTMFQLGTNIKKEAYPYGLYRINMIDNFHIPITEACKYLTCEDKIQFQKNIKELNLTDNSGTKFNAKLYAKFYCCQDVRILRDGYNIFRKQMMDFCKERNHLVILDVDHICSASGMGERVAYNEKVFEGIVELKNVTRTFVQQSTQGGVCRSRDNCKYRTKGKNLFMKKGNETEIILQHYPHDIEIIDFDACSLYPSAMFRMGGLPIGKPKIAIKEEELQWDFLSQQDASFMKIKITKVGKHLHMPIMYIKHNQQNRYDDTLWENKTFYVSNIKLEDLITYHKIEFIIEEALYFNEGMNNQLGQMIESLYTLRRRYKTQHNPMQELIKLIMNSIYGKTILKEEDYSWKFVNTEEEYCNYVRKHIKFIKCIEPMTNNNDKYMIKYINDIDKHKNMCHIGTLILDWSKRIMNEVICLAEGKKLCVFYQDTDSIHIMKHELPLLERHYKNTYHRNLVGFQMGQFHSDFPDGADHATTTIICGKKIYFDQLNIINNKGDYITHCRMKGISKNALEEYMVEHKCTMEDIYMKLYNGETLIFDLAKNKPRFKMNRNLTINTLNEFKRKIQCN